MTFDLRQAPLFSKLDDEQLARVSGMSHSIRLDEGQSLFECGDHARRFYMVNAGQIKLFRLSAEGSEKIIDIIQPGNTFAEALMFLEHPRYPVSASAICGAEVTSFDNRQFLDLLRGSIETCFRVMGTMSQRLRGLVKEIDDLTLQSATSRICAMLLEHLRRAGETSFKLQAPKGVLASRLSVKPETFSRILSNLSGKKLIRVKGSQVTVLDPKQLHDLAHVESLIGLEPLPPSVNPCPLTAGKGRK